MRSLLTTARFDFYWGQGIADDVPALTYYLLLSLAPLALGLAALQALLLQNARGDRGRRRLNRFLPDAVHGDIMRLVLGTRDNSPMLLAIALVARCCGRARARSASSSAASRGCSELPAPRRVVIGRIRNIMLGAGVALMVDRRVRRGAPVIGDAADALNLRAVAAGLACSLVLNTSARSSCSPFVYHWAPRARPRLRVVRSSARCPPGIAIQAVPALVGLYFGRLRRVRRGAAVPAPRHRSCWAST